MRTLSRILASIVVAAMLVWPAGAEPTDAESQFLQGLEEYRLGDYAEAVKWYRMAAEQGHAVAQHNLGFMYAEGQGVPQDYAEAFRWYRMAAEQGDADAQFQLGSMYEIGIGVSKDNAETVRLWRKAAELGHADAQHYLASRYHSGSGVLQDFTEAARLWHMAAVQGHAWAQTYLGMMYEFGTGVPQDHVQAHMWYNLAAAVFGNRYSLAGLKREDIAVRSMASDQIIEAQRRARACLASNYQNCD